MKHSAKKKQHEQWYGIVSYEALFENNKKSRGWLFVLSLGYIEMVNGQFVWKDGLASSTVGLKWRAKEFGLILQTARSQ